MPEIINSQQQRIVFLSKNMLFRVSWCIGKLLPWSSLWICKKKKKSWGLEKSEVWIWRSLIVPLTPLQRGIQIDLQYYVLHLNSSFLVFHVLALPADYILTLHFNCLFICYICVVQQRYFQTKNKFSSGADTTESGWWICRPDFYLYSLWFHVRFQNKRNCNCLSLNCL